MEYCLRALMMPSGVATRSASPRAQPESSRVGQTRSRRCVVTGRRSEHALYSESLASYGIGETFPHHEAAGFIGITALETQLVAARKQVQVA